MSYLASLLGVDSFLNNVTTTATTSAPVAAMDTSFWNSNPSSNENDYYWEPHTSSIDFCEGNYAQSNYIVEVHNAWSSLVGFSLVGLFGIVYGNPTKERRTAVLYFLLVVIGIGSTLLHASLHWIFQSSDELPMIYLVICAVYCCLEIDSPIRRRENEQTSTTCNNNSNSNNNNNSNTKRYPILPYCLAFLSLGNTIIYYSFRHLFIFFFMTFTCMVIGVLILHVQIAKRIILDRKRAVSSLQKEDCTTSPESKQRIVSNCNLALFLYKWHFAHLLAFAFPSWILDQFCCDILTPYYTSIWSYLPYCMHGFTLHVVWHICSGLCVHYLMQFLCACRIHFLGGTCRLHYVCFNTIPVIVSENDKCHSQ